MQQLNDAHTLARQARAQSGGIHSTGTPGISLLTNEFEKALDYCRNVYHEKFMLNENLKREYTEFRNDPQSMQHTTKKRIRNQFRGAFRNWITKLVGDWNFFMTVLKHGIFDSTSRREFLQALPQERQAAMSSSVDAHHAADVPSEDVPLRALLLPGGLNEINVLRIREHSWWPRIRPNRTQDLYVCICEDGRDKPVEGGDVLIKCLKMLVGGDDTMTVQTVQMHWENIGEHIARCDVWYMCGGQPENFLNLFIKH